MLEISNYLELFVDAVTFRAPQNWCLGSVISLLVLWPSLSRHSSIPVNDRLKTQAVRAEHLQYQLFQDIIAQDPWCSFAMVHVPCCLLDQILGHINEITRKKFASVVGEASGIFQELRSDG